MSLNLNVPDRPNELRPHILVFGVGGAGGNAVNNMIRSNLEGVDCIVANTDAQALSQSLTERRLQLGRTITQGLGAGSRPDIGRAAAEEGLDEIVEQLQDVHMVFIAAGMGGGTGTGAAPVIARATREQGILTVGVVTKPFHFEGPNRMRIADSGLEELQQHVDTMIVIPNQNLFRVATDKTTFAEAFRMADDVLYSGVRGVTDLMVMPGLINLDFADIRTVMSEMGKAMMGAGEAEGEERSREAAEAAISNPLLDDVSMNGARGVLINITGGPDMTLYEVDEAVNRVRDEVDANANLIFGSTFDQELEGRIRVSIFATGIEADSAAMPSPTNIRIVARNARGAQPATRPEPARDAESMVAPLAGPPTPADLPTAEPDPDPVPQDLPDPAADPETAWQLSGDLPETALAPAAVGPAMTATPDIAPMPAMATVSAPPFFAGSEAPDLDLPPAADDLPALPDLPPASDMFDEFPAPLPAVDLEAEIEPLQEPRGRATNPYAMPAADDNGPGRGLGRPALDAGRRLLRALRGGDDEEPDGESAENRGDGPAPLAGLEPGASGKTAGEEADLLEIPAFLRRQAN